MKNCGTCKFWSEKIARSHGDGTEALCLGDNDKQEWTTENHSCSKHEFGEPIDVMW